MKILTGCLFTVLFVCAYTLTFAQTASSALHGKIFTDKAEPADAATLLLLRARDSSVVQSALSAPTGEFIFNNLPAGSYLIFATKLNFNKLYSGPYQVAAGKAFDAGTITLKPAVNQLNEVSITGKRDYVEVKTDKTVLNVEQNIMAGGASLYDILNTAPGVKVTNEDILYRGGQRTLIAINGKPVLQTGEELINFLKNYQSSSISRIELIDNPAGKYDASGGGGMINIVLKKNSEMGSNAIVTATGAYGDKYKLNTGINYNLRTEKLNLFASYSYANNKTPHSINTDRNIRSGNDIDNFNLDYRADIKSSINSFSVGADYELTPRQTIGLLINGYDNNSNFDKRSTTRIFTNNALESSINTQSTIDRDIFNINYGLNYRADLGKSGKSVLSADFNYSDYHRHSNEILQNDFYNATGQVSSEPVFYTDNSPSHIKIRSENIDFSQVLSNSINMDAGIKNSQVNSNNMIDFEQLINGAFVTVPELTDHFLYNERINSGYLKFNGKFNKTTLSVGLRAEETNTSTRSVNPERQSDSSYFSLFPNIQITQELSDEHKLTLFYARNINRPQYQDLNPFVGYVDTLYKSTGNPFLKPAYVNTYQLSDLYLNKYKFSLSAIITNNYFYTIFQQNDATKVYTTTKANLGTRYQYRAEFNIPIDITRWWNVNADIAVYHERYVYAIDNAGSKSDNDLSVNLSQSFKITPKLSAQLVGDYESPAYFVISQYQALYWLNAGIRYSIMKNNGSIRLSVSDIFNTEMNKYHTNFANLDITSRDKAGSRFVQATFTYHFGSISVKARSNKDSSEEQKRLGSSTNEN
ncbi:MAG TPA: TonB-dependent receptor [Mucilaginibacter sp.]|nr:TonB-dependent receptor [Mucilaginibacter sp.]